MDKYFALAWLRSVIAFRGMRGKFLQFLANGILAGIIFILSVTVALAVGFLTYTYHLQEQDGAFRALFLIVFWLIFTFAVILPLMRGQFQETFDCRPLLMFPLSERKLFNLSLVSSFFISDHLLYYPTILAFLVVVYLLAPSSFLTALILLGLFICFNVLAGYAAALMVGAVMRNRRAREVSLVLSFVVILLLLIALPLLDMQENRLSLPAIFHNLVAFLPPQLVGEAYLNLYNDSITNLPLGVMLIWVMVFCGLSFILFKKQLKQRPQISGSHDSKFKLAFFSLDRGPLAMLESDLRAVVGKELRYLFRSMSGRINFIALPAVTFLIINLVKRRNGAGAGMMALDDMSLFGVMVYVMLLLANFINNIFAFEGAGMRAYFAGPIDLGRVVLGKNIGLWLYASPFPFIVLAIWAGVLGFQPYVFLSALLFFALGLLVSTMLGNWLSVAFPLAKDPATLNNSGKTIAMLVGFLGLTYIGILAFAILAVPRMTSLPLELPIVLGLLVFHIFLYRQSLAGVGEMMHERREALIDAFK